MLAVPVCAEDSLAEVGREVDEIVCAFTPTEFHGVGLWYDDFTQTTDEEVVDLLARRAREVGGPLPTRDKNVRSTVQGRHS